MYFLFSTFCLQLISTASPLINSHKSFHLFPCLLKPSSPLGSLLDNCLCLLLSSMQQAVF
ncbi:hypothetical protein EXN66_Car002866 [Channa argus]|uniref:Uncharacterized protein n=1 Tax=Channa argus TaxID=215402 RepID=A0A6G1PAP1_CHAAH|nr:hypothetical protein EXN66_Car002866 [Channa argus]